LSRIIVVLSKPFQLLFRTPAAWLSTIRALKAASPAMQAAVAAGLLLVLMTIIGSVLQRWSDNSPDWGVVFIQYTIWMLGLTLIIPPLVYGTVRVWMEGPVSHHPDIDRAWQDGVAALDREGLSLATCPVFLVLGLRNERQVRAFMNAATAKDLKYSVFGAPEGGSNPLYFYAVKNYPLKKDESFDAIYIVLTDASQLSKLVSMASESRGEKALREPDDTVRFNDTRSTAARQQSAAGGGLNETIREDGGVASATLDDETPRPTSAAAIRGTLIGDLRTTRVESGGSTPGDSHRPTEVLDKSEQSRQSDRLAYVCRLLERARDPYCTLNGVLVVTPFRLLRRGVEQVKHLAAATRNDLHTIQRHARLRCPVVSLVGGMEHEPGFCELVRRVGPGPASEQRIGMGFDPWNPASRERMEALAVHASDRVEGNVYDLFKVQDGYNKPGNGKLYNLVCHTRTGFVDLLKAYLSHAFAESDDRPMLFAGCYFAATGETERIKGFLKSVLADKMLISQDDLQWTDEAVQADRRCHILSAACMLLSGVMLLAIIGMLIAWMVWPRT
jgi:hypothetical protein